MIMLLVAVLVVILTGLFVLWAARLPGEIIIDLGTGTAFEIKLVVALLGLALIGVLVAVIWSFLVRVIKFPGQLSQIRHTTRVRDANKALAEGLLAAEAGDAALAAKLGRRAQAYADDDRLKLLLEARTAEVSDNWAAAESAWGQLARLPGGQLAGLRGIASAASARGDRLSAEAKAREALEFKSSAEWPFESLFDSQVSAHQWSAALDTLALGERRGLLAEQTAKRRRAVLLTVNGLDQLEKDRRAATGAFSDATRLAPGFAPAAFFTARHLANDRKFKLAQNTIETAWKSRPHPALAHLLRQMETDGPVSETIDRLKSLAACNQDHRESRIILAELAMTERAWQKAVRDLANLAEAGTTARLCLLLEKALIGYGDTKEAERWARLATTSAHEQDWSDLDPNGGAFNYGPEDWAQMIYVFGDTGKLTHPRYETAQRQVDAGQPLLIDAPGVTNVDAIDTPLSAAPRDYVADDDEPEK